MLLIALNVRMWTLQLLRLLTIQYGFPPPSMEFWQLSVNQYWRHISSSCHVCNYSIQCSTNEGSWGVVIVQLPKVKGCWYWASSGNTMVQLYRTDRHSNRISYIIIYHGRLKRVSKKFDFAICYCKTLVSLAKVHNYITFIAGIKDIMMHSWA